MESYLSTEGSSTRPETIQAVAVALRVVDLLGIEIRWTQDNTPFACYLPDFHVILLNKDVFMQGNALIDENVQQLVHCLFHECAHAIWMRFWKQDSGNMVNHMEEIWADNFASDLCRLLGCTWAAERPSPYVEEFGRLYLEFM